MTKFPRINSVKFEAPCRGFNAIDLFCGCGAVSLGLKKAGFNVLAAVDFEPTACATYRDNHPEVLLLEKDICEVTPSQLLKNQKTPLDLMVVCAPCQPFSSQNKYRHGDERAKLVLQAVRFAQELEPKLILFENVPGLASDKNQAIIKELIDGLKRLGYSVGEPMKLNAADYAVPQRRMRCIMFASRSSLPELSPPLYP